MGSFHLLMVLFISILAFYKLLWAGIAIILYGLYYKLLNFIDAKIPGKKKHFKFIEGNIPAHANGWFCLLKSSELAIGETKYIKSHGEDIALFRGENGKVYGIDAFCPHQGANIAIGGVVKDSCIQCPFHGACFDGETGKLVIPGGKKTQRTLIQYDFETAPDEHNQPCLHLNEKKKVKIQTKKYTIKEMTGYIFCWFNASNKYKNSDGTDNEDEIPYLPLDCTDFLAQCEFRGRVGFDSYCHFLDIATNGYDANHFNWVHTRGLGFIPQGNKYQYFKFATGNDPDLYEKIIDEKENENLKKFLIDVMKRFITKENEKYVRCLLLKTRLNNLPFDGYVFQLQVGPGLAYTFIYYPYLGNVLFGFNYVNTEGTSKQVVVQDYFTKSWYPYVLSALQVWIVVYAIKEDVSIFDHKKFTKTKNFMDSIYDEDLVKHCQWITQFYDGCELVNKYDGCEYEW